MKKISFWPVLLTVPMIVSLPARAQDDWPRQITAADGSIIRVYHPQPDSFFDNNLRFRAAFSVVRKGGGDSCFGSFCAYALIGTDRNARQLAVLSANLIRMDLAGTPAFIEAGVLKETIECGLPGIGSGISIDRLLSMMDYVPAPRDLSTGLAHDPPNIIFWGRPSILVFIDGYPRLKWDKDYGLYVVANSPYTIVESSDGWFYLYGGRHWYIAPMPEGPWHPTDYTAPDLQKAKRLINGINDRDADHADSARERTGGIVDVITSTTPAELVRIKGSPVFSAIPGTNLQYIANSDNDIFRDSLRHQYYLLISGRWFCSAGLTGPWKYFPADSLPPDFAAIPEGSPEDRVLASVPGTLAAWEAIIDAGIPQTAIIDRRAVTATIVYDGAPRFASIRGTRLQYATNTAAVVLREGGAYYCLDKGIWFISRGAGGPWTASTKRPDEVASIPPDCPVYHSKYVYIYGVDGDRITTGYTSGYLGAYVDGSTLVFGTGYYYPSYMGNFACPRPWTFGFNMWYNPWFGWTLGAAVSPDWLNTATAWGEGYWNSGWWGPPGYRPPYIWHHFSGQGLYEWDVHRVAGSSYNNNVYSLRRDVPGLPAPDRLIADTAGHVYRFDAAAGWMRRSGDRWSAQDKGDVSTYLDRLSAQQERGEMRTRNFRQAAGWITAPVMVLSSTQSLQYGGSKQ
ncbi:MAG TPA: hypothetical protein VHE54_19215 [Puia sp.]|nr:hypothetical protein [Puia sp.]